MVGGSGKVLIGRQLNDCESLMDGQLAIPYYWVRSDYIRSSKTNESVSVSAILEIDSKTI